MNPAGYRDAPGAAKAVAEAFSATHGTVPNWVRPGEFLLWLGYIPMPCIWGGYAKPNAMLMPADPDGLWVSDQAYLLVPGATVTISPKWRDVADLFRASLGSR